MRRSPYPIAICLVAAVLAACASPPPVVVDLVQPPFVDALIARLQAEPVANPPASVWRYHYAGRTVFYVPPKCCDFPSELYEADGDVICQPDGGLTGRGDGRCPDFHATRRDGVRVWLDPRG